MEVHKFGGSVFKNISDIKKVLNIIKKKTSKILIVISAFDKITSILEKLYFTGDKKFLNIFFEYHALMISDLKNHYFIEASELLFYTKNKIIEILKNKNNTNKQLALFLSYGEFLSSNIITLYFKQQNINTKWINSIDIIKTDRNFLEANINESQSKKQITSYLLPQFNDYSILVTQGFIAKSICSNTQEYITTLGKEGSDYTAAFLAKTLNVKSLVLWKDVFGVHNADPKIFKNAKLLNKISYEDLQKMSINGSKIVHYKTIDALKKNNIELKFQNTTYPDKTLTTVYNCIPNSDVEKYILLSNQRILVFTVFDKIREYELNYLFKLAKNLKINYIEYNRFYLIIVIDEDTIDETVFAKIKSLFIVFDIKNMNLLKIFNFYKALDSRNILNANNLFTKNFSKTIDVKKSFSLHQTHKDLFIALKSIS